MRAQIQLSEASSRAVNKMAPLTGSLDRVIDDMHAYREIGVRHMALWPRESSLEAYLQQMERIAQEIAPAFASTEA